MTLKNLKGLSNLTFVGDDLTIWSNQNLDIIADYCGLYTLLQDDGLKGNFDISLNGYNPTISEIIAHGACSTSSLQIDDGPFNHSLGMKPIPAKDWVTLNMFSNEFDDLGIKFIDVSGKTVKMITRNVIQGWNEIHIDISQFPAGIYFVTIISQQLYPSQIMIKS